MKRVSAFLRVIVPVVCVLAAPQVLAAPDQVCRDYAGSAVGQNRENVKLGCGLKGRAWSNDEKAHYQWCLGAAESVVAGETKSRENALAACRRQKGRSRRAPIASSEPHPVLPSVSVVEFNRLSQRVADLEQEVRTLKDNVRKNDRGLQQLRRDVGNAPHCSPDLSSSINPLRNTTKKCFPYACDEATGFCRTSCTSTADCAVKCDNDGMNAVCDDRGACLQKRCNANFP